MKTPSPSAPWPAPPATARKARPGRTYARVFDDLDGERIYAGHEITADARDADVIVHLWDASAGPPHSLWPEAAWEGEPPRTPVVIALNKTDALSAAAAAGAASAATDSADGTGSGSGVGGGGGRRQARRDGGRRAARGAAGHAAGVPRVLHGFVGAVFVA